MQSQFANKLRTLYINRDLTKLEKLCQDKIYKKLTHFYTYKIALDTLKKLDSSILIKKKIITVITVNYNNINGLRETISSVTNQTSINDVQFIVVDGNSSDGSLDLITEHQSNIDVAVFGKDKNVYDAMNRGISLANSEFTIFMNSGDCFASNNVVEKIISKIDNSSNIDIYYGATELENNVIWKPLPAENLWKGMICSHQSMFFRTNVLKNCFYNTENEIVSDFELMYRLYTDNHIFKTLDLTIGKIEPVGISADFRTRTLERWLVVRKYVGSDIRQQEVDAFYSTLLSTNGEWSNPHNHQIDYSQYNLIANTEKRVIFLISMPRSGSTLLQKILDRSDDIATGGEPWLMLPLLSMYDDELITAKYGQELNIMARDEFQDDIGDKNITLNAQKTYANSVYSTALKKSNKRYFLDKTPRYIYIAEKLEKIYPNAKFVILLRNPAAVISSYVHTWLGGSFDRLLTDEHFKYDFSNGFKKLGKFTNSNSKNRIIVRYENLVKNPEEEAEKIFKYLQLPFDKSFLNYNTDKKIKKYTFGDPGTVYSKERPDSSNSDKWLSQVKTRKEAKQLLGALELIPNSTFNDLGYSITDIKYDLSKNNQTGLPNFKEIHDKFGSNANLIKPSENNKTLGVLITCFNNEETIYEAIKSVATQSKKADLILIADDLSTDLSIDEIERATNDFKEINIKTLIQEKNVGVSKNRDIAIRKMTTDYISTLDGDDSYYPGKLIAEYNALDCSIDKVSFSDIVMLTDKESVRLDTSKYNAKKITELVGMLTSRSAPVPRDMMFPRSLFERADGFDTDMPIYEDWSLKMRMMSLSDDNSWVHSGAIGTIYDRRSPGLSNRPAVFHAYGQLLALCRNINFLTENPQALKDGLMTSARHLEGGVKIRLEKFAAEISESTMRETSQRLEYLWKERDWSNNSKMINDIVWELTKPMIENISGAINKACKDFITINICTPVYNGKDTIDKTIKSILDQKGDFHIRYHIQDGGSTDGTLTIIKNWIKKIENQEFTGNAKSIIVTYESAPDNGMYDAIAKAISTLSPNRSDWISWINADDYFEVNSFQKISDVEKSFGNSVNWITGKSSVITEDGNKLRSFRPLNENLARYGLCDGIHWEFIQQEGTFFRQTLWSKLNLNTDFINLKYAGDWNIWRIFGEHEKLFLHSEVLANFCKRKGQLSEVAIIDYMNEIDTIIPLHERKIRFVNFPIFKTKQHILEKQENKLCIKESNILGHFEYRSKKYKEKLSRDFISVD
tara:strand:- start:2177 stop:5929 length:3753 start_codon:yes stop_codon:yes gene_type:complete